MQSVQTRHHPVQDIKGILWGSTVVSLAVDLSASNSTLKRRLNTHTLQQCTPIVFRWKYHPSKIVHILYLPTTLSVVRDISNILFSRKGPYKILLIHEDCASKTIPIILKHSTRGISQDISLRRSCKVRTYYLAGHIDFLLLWTLNILVVWIWISSVEVL